MEDTLNVVETTGAEEPEVAAPVVEGGAEEQEIAEPVVKKTADEAFAEMRRMKQETENKLAQKEAENRQLSDALKLFFNGDTSENLAAQAIAYHSNRPVTEVQKELAEKTAAENLKTENESLKEQLKNIHVQSAMERDLREIQKIDPAVKSLDELGSTYINLIAAGLDGIDAYYAAKAREAKETLTPPQPPGKVKAQPTQKDYFTKEEVAAMSREEVKKNYDAVRASMSKW